MAVKQFLSDETIFYTDDLDGSFGDKVLATANATASAVASAVASSGGIMLLTISQSGDDTVLDKNYNEIKDAVESSVIPFALNTNIPGITSINMAIAYGLIEGTYIVIISPLDANQPNMTFAAASADGVLTLQQGD